MAITADSFLKMSSGSKAALAIIIAAVIIGGYYWLFYSAKSDDLGRLKADHTRLIPELNKLRENVGKKDQLKKENQSLKDRLNEARIILPEKKEIPTLLSTVSSLGREARLQFLTFKPLPEAMETFYARVPVEISVSGSFHDVAIFFDKVSKLPRVVNISNISMDRKGANGRVVVLTTGLATTYRFLSEAEMAKLAEEKKAKEAKEKKVSPGVK